MDPSATFGSGDNRPRAQSRICSARPRPTTNFSSEANSRFSRTSVEGDMVLKPAVELTDSVCKPPIDTNQHQSITTGEADPPNDSRRPQVSLILRVHWFQSWLDLSPPE